MEDIPNTIRKISPALWRQLTAIAFMWKRGGNKKPRGMQQAEPTMETNLSRS